MALSERSRSTIYQRLTPMLGEEVTAEMLSYFPARDVEEPATKEQLDLLRAEMRAEMSELRGELLMEMASLRDELHTDMADLRHELHSDMATLRHELHTDMATLRIGMERQLNRMTVWLAGSVFTAAGLVIASMRLGG
ncbi:MAG: DUF1640 domain-containing protein [Acidimicrobiia bacterium]|nr:DUF1640 domain-containing protein [Acidimicrobiia bacterium]